MSGVAGVSAVVVTYREVALTLAAVASLKAQTAPVSEIVVVDNDPERSIAEPLAREHPDVRLLALDNPGHAVACNRGAELVTGDVLVFLDPDAALAPDALERMLAALRESPRAALASPQILFADRPTVNAGENPVHLTGLSWCGRYDQPPESGPPRTVFTTSGACHVVRADAFRAVGGYCEDYFVLYDDPDLCWRLWIAGHEVVYVPGRAGHARLPLRREPAEVVLARAPPPLLGARQLRGAHAGAARSAAGRLRAGPARARRAAGLAAAQARRLRARCGARAARCAPAAAPCRPRARSATRRIVPLIAGRIESGQLANPLLPLVNPLLAAYHRGVVAVLRS